MKKNASPSHNLKLLEPSQCRFQSRFHTRHLDRLALVCSTFIFLITLGCATAEVANNGRGTKRYQFGSEPDVWDYSQAPGAAYGAHNFTLRKYQPVGATNNHVFYFKKCDDTGNAVYYSKTSYECTEP